MLVVAVTLGLIVSIPVIARSVGIDGVTPIPQLLGFYQWTLPAVLVVVGCAIASRRRWALGISVVLLVVVALQLVPVRCGVRGLAATDSEGTVLTVTAANVFRGRGTDSLLTLLAESPSDVVVVPECENDCWAQLNGPDISAEYPHRWLPGPYGRQATAVLSRYPIVSRSLDMGAAGMPVVVLDVDGIEVTVVAVHTAAPMPKWVDRWKADFDGLRVWLAAHDGPVVLAGDFNATIDHGAFRRLLGTPSTDAAAALGVVSGTWPAHWPQLAGSAIDHVVVSGGIGVVAVGTAPVEGSDHRAITATLALPSR